MSNSGIIGFIGVVVISISVTLLVVCAESVISNKKIKDVITKEIDACEQKLPRDEHCILIAVPKGDKPL